MDVRCDTCFSVHSRSPVRVQRFPTRLGHHLYKFVSTHHTAKTFRSTAVEHMSHGCRTIVRRPSHEKEKADTEAQNCLQGNEIRLIDYSAFVIQITDNASPPHPRHQKISVTPNAHSSSTLGVTVTLIFLLFLFLMTKFLNHPSRRRNHPIRGHGRCRYCHHRSPCRRCRRGRLGWYR